MIEKPELKLAFAQGALTIMDLAGEPDVMRVLKDGDPDDDVYKKRVMALLDERFEQWYKSISGLFKVLGR